MAIKLRILTLFYCGVLNPELNQLIQVAQQNPVLPKIVELNWSDEVGDRDTHEVNWEIFELFRKTLRDTCPHLRTMTQ
jgi:hypothetical protein